MIKKKTSSNARLCKGQSGKKLNGVIIFPFEEFAAHFTRNMISVFLLFSRAESGLDQAIKINESRKRSPGNATEKIDFFSWSGDECRDMWKDVH